MNHRMDRFVRDPLQRMILADTEGCTTYGRATLRSTLLTPADMDVQGPTLQRSRCVANIVNV